MSCGHVWMTLDLKDLRVHARMHANELIRQHLESLEHGPHRGLPDSAEAREVDDQVAAIDCLLITGKQGEATRRYRERTGCTWDEALEKIREWPDLKRSVKLSLLG
jgi:hypothetical protein